MARPDACIHNPSAATSGVRLHRSAARHSTAIMQDLYTTSLMQLPTQIYGAAVASLPETPLIATC